MRAKASTWASTESATGPLKASGLLRSSMPRRAQAAASMESMPVPHLQITLSLGVSSLACGAESEEALIAQADDALYASKQGGRNRVTRFDRMPAGR